MGNPRIWKYLYYKIGEKSHWLFLIYFLLLCLAPHIFHYFLYIILYYVWLHIYSTISYIIILYYVWLHNYSTISYILFFSMFGSTIIPLFLKYYSLLCLAPHIFHYFLYIILYYDWLHIYSTISYILSFIMFGFTYIPLFLIYYSLLCLAPYIPHYWYVNVKNMPLLIDNKELSNDQK